MAWGGPVTLAEYIDPAGRSPYAIWFNSINAPAAAKVATALYRLAAGNFSNVKSVGADVYEYRIHFGPGYRIYFGKSGDRLIILLGGSSKKNQRAAINSAKEAWSAYTRTERGKH